MPAAGKRKREPGNQGHPGLASSDYAFMEGEGEHDLNLAHVLQQHNSGGPQQADQQVSDTANAALQYAIASGQPQHESNYMPQSPDDNSEPAQEPNFDIDSPAPHAATPSHPPPPQAQNGGPSGSNDAANTDPALGGTGIPVTVGGGSLSPSTATGPGAGAVSTPVGQKSKLKAGSEEWQASRRSAHKDVERRRRETINEGINELGKIVPGAERNKGSILSRAVNFINELKQRATDLEEKQKLQEMMFRQTVDGLEGKLREMKAENERLRGEKGKA